MRLKASDTLSELHPVEAAWRRFRSSPNYKLLTRALELRQDYLDSIGLQRLPAEVVLPGAVLGSLFASGQVRVRDKENVSLSKELIGALICDAMTWAAYRGAKTIFEVEPALGECLDESPWPDATLTAALRLPSRCPVFCLTDGRDPAYVAAVYDLLAGQEHARALTLRLNGLHEGHWRPLSFLDLVGDDLQGCVRRAAEAAISRGAPATAIWDLRSKRAGLVLTLLLYLGGEPDVVREVHPGERPVVKPKMQRSDPERFKDLRDPTIYAVGKTFAQAVERWEIEHRDDPGVATGRTVRPHMRRAHSHLYWTGPGRETPRVRFLLPVSVKGGKLIEEPEFPTEAKVR